LEKLGAGLLASRRDREKGMEPEFNSQNIPMSQPPPEKYPTNL